jgi:hypothetical protein
MDFVSGAISLADKVGEAYGDYKTGKMVRLGQYVGSDNVKKMGHYNSKLKRLGIYQG